MMHAAKRHRRFLVLIAQGAVVGPLVAHTTTTRDVTAVAAARKFLCDEGVRLCPGAPSRCLGRKILALVPSGGNSCCAEGKAVCLTVTATRARTPCCR